METVLIKTPKGKYRRRPRGSVEPYVNRADGHVVERKLTDLSYRIVRLFAHYQYMSIEYATALLGKHSYEVVRRQFRVLIEKRIIRLCERQRTVLNERLVGTLYHELDNEGYAILSEEGKKLPKREDKIFAHTLMVCQIMQSIEIGMNAQSEVKLVTRDDLARKLPLPKRDGKEQYMISDHGPFSLVRDGKFRNIAGLEADTGSMPISTADANRTAIVHKFEHILYLIKSGTIEREYRWKQFYFLFVFRTDARKESAMAYLEKMTEREPHLRRHFLFKRHPVYGKSADKPRATGHMADEPWKTVGNGDVYLLKPKEVQ